MSDKLRELLYSVLSAHASYDQREHYMSAWDASLNKPAVFYGAVLRFVYSSQMRDELLNKFDTLERRSNK